MIQPPRPPVLPSQLRPQLPRLAALAAVNAPFHEDEEAHGGVKDVVDPTAALGAAAATTMAALEAAAVPMAVLETRSTTTQPVELVDGFQRSRLPPPSARASFGSSNQAERSCGCVVVTRPYCRVRARPSVCSHAKAASCAHAKAAYCATTPCRSIESATTRATLPVGMAARSAEPAGAHQRAASGARRHRTQAQPLPSSAGTRRGSAIVGVLKQSQLCIDACQLPTCCFCMGH